MGTPYVENVLRGHKRDKELFRYLAAGVATVAMLHRDIFADETGAEIRRQTRDRRLDKHRRRGYIVKQRIDRFQEVITVYALTELGRNVAADILSIEPQCVRTGIPRPEKINHELILSAVMRKVMSEVRENKYRLELIYDDTVMRSQKKPRRGVYYPDLFLRLIRPQKGPLDIFIELDAGGKVSLKYWTEKISSWSHVAILLFCDRQKMNSLKNCMLSSSRTEYTAFGLADAFIAHGLAGTEFDWLPDKRKGKINLA